MTTSVGTPLATYLAALDVAQRSLAEEVGVTPGYLNQIVKGHRRPSVLLAKSIARVLELPETVLFPQEGDPQ